MESFLSFSCEAINMQIREVCLVFFKEVEPFRQSGVDWKLSYACYVKWTLHFLKFSPKETA